MDKIEKIRQEVEELYARIDECIDTLIKARVNKDTNGEGKSLFQMEGLMVGTQQFLCWILDTLSEEPDTSLEEAAKEYAEGPECTWVGTTALEEAFKAGAKCQKEQDTRDMFMSDNRHFNKVYELGKKDMKEQMLKDAVEGEIQMRYSGCLCAKTIRAINEDKFKLGDKVRIVVLKAEEE